MWDQLVFIACCTMHLCFNLDGEYLVSPTPGWSGMNAVQVLVFSCVCSSISLPHQEVRYVLVQSSSLIHVSIILMEAFPDLPHAAEMMSV